MTALAPIFHALGDPVRLEIVQRLTRHQPCTIAVATDGLGITRQGARKHLQVLADARVISLAPAGRQTLVSLTPATLTPAATFLARLERQWDRRLEALRRFAEES